MFVLWPPGGDCEEGYQEEKVWKTDADKQNKKSEVISGTPTALSEMSHDLEI